MSRSWRHLPDSPWSILSVATDASPDDLQLAYRSLSRELHPDVNADPDAHERMRLVTWAYAVVTHPDHAPAALRHFHPPVPLDPSPRHQPPRTSGRMAPTESATVPYASVPWGRPFPLQSDSGRRLLVAAPDLPTPAFEYESRSPRKGAPAHVTYIYVSVQPPTPTDLEALSLAATRLLARIHEARAEADGRRLHDSLDRSESDLTEALALLDSPDPTAHWRAAALITRAAS